MLRRDQLAQGIVKYVEQSWKRGVTVKEVAAKVGADPSYVARLFRRLTGKPIACYVQEKRKEYVVFMVRTTGCYSYEAARELGYQEEHSFTRWVKNAFGMSWTELCRLHRDDSLPPLARTALHR
jgi:AraC-like DNA-binding protein